MNQDHVKRLSEYQPKENIVVVEKKETGEPTEKKAKYQFTGISLICTIPEIKIIKYFKYYTS